MVKLVKAMEKYIAQEICHCIAESTNSQMLKGSKGRVCLWQCVKCVTAKNQTASQQIKAYENCIFSETPHKLIGFEAGKNHLCV